MADYKSLWAHPETICCCIERQCVPCLYKLCSKDARGELAVGAMPPNQRPEQCPRNKITPVPEDVEMVGLYSAAQRILTVGDGDFSFSRSLARLRRAPGSLLLATSHESAATVQAIYPTSAGALSDLRRLRVDVAHGVDATDLHSSPEVDRYRRNGFDRIVWNFPCISAARRADDGQVAEITMNQRLLSSFFISAQDYLSEGGEIHVTHKTIEPFSWWGLVRLAEDSGLRHVASVAFDRCMYQGYVNRKVLDKKSFPAHDAETYIFMRSSERSVATYRPIPGIELLWRIPGPAKSPIIDNALSSHMRTLGAGQRSTKRTSAAAFEQLPNGAEAPAYVDVMSAGRGSMGNQGRGKPNRKLL
jgi:25S rRNA (uracil2634-N3)-methyltransferase